MTYSGEQLLHDEINARRLVRRLEKSLADPFWDESLEDDAWIKAQGTLQKVKYARKLLKNVELYDESPSPTKTEQFDELRIILDRVQAFMTDVEKRKAPKPQLPVFFDVPTPSIPPLSENTDHPITSPNEAPLSSTLPADDLLPADDDFPTNTPSHPTTTSFSSPTTLIPSTILLSATSTTTGTTTATATSRNPHSNSTALHQELSDQLAQMAAQLKRNAIHFSDSLAKDQAVVSETEQKLEENHGMMEKERIRLRDHSGKSRGTTCLTVMILLAVVLLFTMMVVLIRFSRR